MHCVVNELGKGMLHTANTMGILRCFQFSQSGTGSSGEVGGICHWARSAGCTVCAVTEGGQSSVGWWHHLNTSGRLGLRQAVLTEQGCALQTLQVFELLVSGTELLVTHTASCRLTWHGTDSSGRAILLSEELSKPPSAALEELYSVKMQCRTQS